MSWVALATVLWVSGCDCGGTPPLGPCDNEDDCDEGQTCVDGVCMLRVESDAAAADSNVRLDGGPLPDTGPDSGVDGSAFGPCAFISCNPGQRCEVSGSSGSCVDNLCEDLSCLVTERCEPHPMGGNVCVDLSCDTDVDCDENEYCGDSEICEADICVPEASRCDGLALIACADNGGSESTRFSCTSPSPFVSECVEGATASCTCEDDWDCPAFTDCEVSSCAGTGVEPTCTLPPVPFTDVPPTIEFHWGGESRANDDARDGTADANPAPWAVYAHVVSTPIVANLDDDNGDGLVNELDFPEIIFTAHEGNNPWDDGVLRAVHGGGPNKGADYFARCGDDLWNAGEAVPTGTCSPDADSGTPVAVADLNRDGFPEIVYMTEGNTFRILDNTGAELFHLSSDDSWSPTTVGETAAVADLNADGFGEVIVGRYVYLFDVVDDVWVLTHRLSGDQSSGQNGIGQMVCPADLLSAFPGQEFVAGATLYRLPETLPTCATAPCTGSLVVAWDATDSVSGNGFCAIADVWGADHEAAPGPLNLPDGTPEVVLIDDGDLTILDAATGALIEDRDLGGGARGGAPNVDDFDGDGFMEIASALQDFYIVVDLQEPTASDGSCPAWPTVLPRDPAGVNPNPERTPGGVCATDGECDPDAVCNTTRGQCVCLHNGWTRDSDDDSSRATSSSVFDFNGDGAAEVLYNDECDFRVYDGLNGEVLFSAVSRSRTGIENPVVADVDNDGNAEVVAMMNTAQTGRCDEDSTPIGPNGIIVWGDPSDTWVSARRVWNQQSYHVVNTTEGTQIPSRPPASWSEYNGRVYNTYRSQPRSFGVAPDLTVVDIGISSPDVACGSLSDTIEIAFEIRNDGDLRVGPGVRVVFFGDWGGSESALLNAEGDPLSVEIDVSLEPGRSLLRSVTYDRAYNGEASLPDFVRVVVDPTSGEFPNGAERECIEDNNDREEPVDAGTPRADLTITVGAATTDCPAASVEVTVENIGSAPATNVDVVIFAGDPSAGGSEVHREVIASLAAGASTMMDFAIPMLSSRGDITLFGVVNPDRTVDECNIGNNVDPADNAIACADIPF